MKTIALLALLCACGDDAAGTNLDGSVDGDGNLLVDAAPDNGDSRMDDSLPPQPQIPGGTFFRSYDGVGYMNMGYPATVSGFALDKYEVTVARFRVFVASTALPTTPLECSSGSVLGTWTAGPAANEMKPINCITWAEADAFCRWDGGRLPTEAEWNYAAAGGSEQREYPWGSTLDSSHANYTTTIVDVGSKPAGDGRWGQSDLAGNVAEWTADWYADPYTNPCVDCVNTTPTTARSQRGGGISGAPPSALLASARRAAAPTNRSVAIGVRCARAM